MENLKEGYEANIGVTMSQYQAARKKVSLLAYSRFFLFILFCFCFWPVFKYAHYWFLLPAGILLAVFIVLVKVQVRTEKEVKFLEVLIKILRAELSALQGDFSAFDDGNRFTDFDHPYTFDLDVFGPASLYQQMNRTSSEMGQRKLAEWLSEHSPERKKILERQEAFRELAQKTTFRQHFQATGSLHPFTKEDQQALSGWLQSNAAKPSFNALAKIMLLVLPVITVTGWALWIAGYLHYGIPSFISSINIYWVYSQTAALNEMHRQLGNKFKVVKNLSHQLLLFEKEEFHSSMLRQSQEALKGEKVSAAKAVHQLGVIMQNFDARLNIFGAFIFNALFLFDLQMSQRLLNWKKQFGTAAAGWLEVISSLEAANSLGTYVYNHPDFVFPNIDESPLIVEAVQMGHPLMPANKRVNNSFDLSGKGKFVIVTGSNMSGKSTFLRTTGLNMVLAQAGAPVCAEKFRFSPVEIHTSMRINDSLQQNESYFYAEIKRLNRIATEAARQKPILILLDEILRGTNSTDKHTGSQALMLKLTELNATGILATHDLSLGELTRIHPGRFVNKCFESVIENNELYFDYKMRDGVCQNLNAVFLMKKMGIM